MLTENSTRFGMVAPQAFVARQADSLFDASGFKHRSQQPLLDASSALFPPILAPPWLRYIQKCVRFPVTVKQALLVRSFDQVRG